MHSEQPRTPLSFSHSECSGVKYIHFQSKGRVGNTLIRCCPVLLDGEKLDAFSVDSEEDIFEENKSLNFEAAIK